MKLMSGRMRLIEKRSDRREVATLQTDGNEVFRHVPKSANDC